MDEANCQMASPFFIITEKPPGKPVKLPSKTLRIIKRQLSEAPGLPSKETKQSNLHLLYIYKESEPLYR